MVTLENLSSTERAVIKIAFCPHRELTSSQKFMINHAKLKKLSKTLDKTMNSFYAKTYITVLKDSVRNVFFVMEIGSYIKFCTYLLYCSLSREI